MIQRLIEKFDWLVYRLAYKSINRMCIRHNGAFALILKLSIEEWLEKYPLPDEVKASAEGFCQAIKEHEYNKEGK